MEVESREAYANSVTIENFMIQINDSTHTLLLQIFSQMSLLWRTFPDHLIGKLYSPPHTSLLYYLPPLLFLHSTISIQKITCNKTVREERSIQGKQPYDGIYEWQSW